MNYGATLEVYVVREVMKFLLKRVMDFLASKKKKMVADAVILKLLYSFFHSFNKAFLYSCIMPRQYRSKPEHRKNNETWPLSFYSLCGRERHYSAEIIIPCGIGRNRIGT